MVRRYKIRVSEPESSIQAANEIGKNQREEKRGGVHAITGPGEAGGEQQGKSSGYGPRVIAFR